jgi:predicted permease
VAGVLFGVAPALHASRLDLVSAMRARQGGGTASRGRSRAADVLVAVQIAVSLVLLIGAGLFARSLLNVQRQPIGFVPDHVLLARLSPRLAGYTPESAVAFYSRLYERLAALPGIDGVTLARYSPFGGSRSVNSGSVQGYTPKAGEEVALETVPVGPDYPTTMGMALLKGRALNRRDTAAGPKVGMVNEAFVRRFLPRVNPVGRHFSIDTDDKVGYEIVGVLADAQFHDARDAIEPIVFTSILQDPSQFSLDCEIALRSSGDTASAARALRQTLAELDPNLPVNDPRTLREQVRSSFDSDRLAASLVAFFSLLALALAAVGLYGTIAQHVALRTNEIGVRMALGAERRGVVWMILRRVLVLLAAGVIVGLPTAILAGRLVASQLFGLRPVDWLSYGIAIGGLVIVALAAGFVPARRATRVDPVRALRAE